MSELANKVAREHEFRWVGSVDGRGCTCGESFDFVPVDCTASAAYARHIVEVTEAIVRERVARDLEVEMRRHDGAQVGFSGKGDTYADAARIARGGIT